ncbi:MAG: aconitate hydratase AcnA, partial [Proteobacteria bacterium]|nr:aconitate hydratase AcnA [Pseudomonadota bacterium]
LNIKSTDIEAVLKWDPKSKSEHEISFMPARVVLQDFTGVPCVVDLAAMRDAIVKLGGDAKKINPLRPVELVIDHSVQVDYNATSDALAKNTEIEFERNKERYLFLKWGQKAFNNFKVVPPSTGIVHQVNLEYLARVVMQEKDAEGKDTLYPDTVVGTDSHTTMINGLGVLGWGVGGIEAEAVMLNQPIPMLIPEVIGFKLSGKLKEGVTATDLVLTVTQMLRKKGVVGKFVEFYGKGLSNLPLADRATVANMAPEYGATCGIFPVDELTLDYLKLTGKSAATINLIREYMNLQGMFRTDETADPVYTDTLELDLSQVESSVAGPSRPQDRVVLKDIPSSFQKSYDSIDLNAKGNVTHNGQTFDLHQGAVTIAAITSCTNTSNPYVMMAAGLLAKKAVARGLKSKPWVKTSLAPGSKVVTDYLAAAGLTPSLDALGFNTVGYGCTTCIGNSGPLADPIIKAIDDNKLTVASVLSGNRNFEGRINPKVRASYLASPPLVVAYAILGTVLKNIQSESLGKDQNGADVYLKDIWPTQQEIQEAVMKNVNTAMFDKSYGNVYDGGEMWKSLASPEGTNYQWEPSSTYIQHPPYFTGMSKTPSALKPIQNARVLALLGDSITTDHISPAGSIAKDGPAAKYLMDNGVAPKDFNSFGARRGSHDVMVRGTFANIRLKNLMVPGTEGGFTNYIPENKTMSIYDAAMKYQATNTSLVVFAGKEYGTGSSRDWAAKGSQLLGIRAVVAESFERIHRSNLIGMGVLPLQFKEGETTATHGLTVFETINIKDLEKTIQTNAKTITIEAIKADGTSHSFNVLVRLDTPREVDYYKHGGILQYVLRSLA